MKTTTDALSELDREFARHMEEERKAHARLREWTRKVCDAGLVSDVAPSGPPPDDVMEVQCGHCGAVLRGLVYSDHDWLGEHACTSLDGSRSRG